MHWRDRPTTYLTTTTSKQTKNTWRESSSLRDIRVISDSVRSQQLFRSFFAHMLASSCWRRQRRPSTLLPQKPCTVVMNMAFSIRLTATNMHSKSTIQNNNSNNSPKWQQQNMPNKIHAAAETRKLSKKKTKTENSLSSRWNATLGIANWQLGTHSLSRCDILHAARRSLQLNFLIRSVKVRY